MHKSLQAMAVCHPAKPAVLQPLFAYRFVKILRDSFAVFKYSSLYSAIFPCATSNPEPFIGPRGGFGGCVEAVGKVVKSLRVSRLFIHRVHNQATKKSFGLIVLNKLNISCRQLLDLFTQPKSYKLPVLVGSLYPLPTRPTNTTKLNKGISL